MIAPGTLGDRLTGDLDVDAVIIGGGPNGLVAACILADAGWDVALLERNRVVGGAIASVERTPGYVSDLYSAFYPLAAASPVIRALELEAHGLTWKHSAAVVAHVPSADAQEAVVLHRDPARTAAALEARAPGDGEAWLRLFAQWQVVRDPLLECLFTAFPAVRGVVRLLARLGTPEALRLARTFVLPVERMGRELFSGSDAGLLLAGNAMHADIPAASAGSGAFGWLLTMLGQDVGFPVPEGGAARLAQALALRARTAGAQVYTQAPVERVVVRGGRALGVVADGHRVRARRAVLADVDTQFLYRQLLRHCDLPARLLPELDRCFERDLPTVKVNWTLRAPVPWRAEGAASAGTVHLGTDVPGLVRWSAALSSGQESPETFQLLGQLAAADPSRVPDGGESLWAYSHLPRGCASAQAALALAERMQREIEAHAPGFQSLVLDRWEQLPQDLEAGDANLVDGTVNGGTAQLHQQLIFRPTAGLGRPETPVTGLYLASAGISPGGGVHGACGSAAARAALAGARAGGVPRRLLVAAGRRLGS